MLINTAFSHSNEECSPYFLLITHQTPARDDIDGLMQERRNSIANTLEYVFLAPSHAMKSIWQCLKLFFFFQFYHWLMYWAYRITLYCTATYREYPIGTTKFVIHNHFPTTFNTYIDYWSQADAVQSLNVVPSICHCYCCFTLVSRVLIVSRWWGWTNMQLLKCVIFVSV